MHRMTRSRLIFTLMALALLLMALSACGDTEEAPSPVSAATEVPAATEAPAEVEETSLTGAEIYGGLCIACHGPDAKGVPNLGKDLTTSDFLASQSDAEMVDFIAEGRPADHPDNTTGVAMPPRGGNPSLTDEDLAAVVSYLRSLVGQ